MQKKFRAFVVFAIVALLLTACAGVNFTLTFQADGKTYATVRTNGKDPVKMPKDPVKEGHVFDGWYWDKDVWEKPLTVNSFLDTPLTENLTVYAKWKVSDAHEHAYGEWETVTPATCAAEGLRKRVCSVCEEAETAAIEKLPHTYGDWTEISPATCSAEGRKTRVCSVCSEAETAAIPKLTHTFQTKFDQAGHWRKCSVCAEEEEKQAHRYENGVCTVCGRIPGTEGLEYSKAAGGYTVRGIGTAAGTAIEIPSDYEGEPVIAIGVIAFYQNNKIESVTVPDSVTRIDEFAFRECGNLKRVTIGDGVTTIGAGAFYDCGNLESVTVGSGVTIIESEAFLGCANLRSVNLPNGVSEIGSSAFAGCGNLQNIMIPEGVSKIGAAAFAGCGSLKSIAIPKSVTNIANGAFRDCGGLETITVAEGNAKYSGAGNSIIETETKTLIYGCKNSVIPAGGSVTAIGDSAFEGCVGLKNIQIPNGVISIGSRAFWGSGLLGIAIPESVTSINNFSFGGSGDLESITVAEGNAKYRGAGNSVIESETKTLLFGCKTSVIPGDGSVTVIGDGAFDGCDGILSIIIPDSVVKIGFRAFSGCEGLTGITIPDSVTEIDYGAFDGCFNLKSVTFGSGVASIGAESFGGCDIETITVSEGNAKYRSAGNSLIEIGTKTLVFGCKNSVIPNDGSVIKIGDRAFAGCNGLQSIAIPDGVTYLGYEAFARCENLLSLTIGNGVTTIGNSAFRECSSLQSVAIPDGVASVDNGAFEFCKNLRSATFGRGVSSIGFGVLNGCVALETITVEEGNAAFYSAGNCIVERSTGTLVAGCKTSVIPNDGSVIKIGDGAFYNCGGLEAVMIPDSVASIGYGAFAGCWGLKTLDLPNGIVSIGEDAFSRCVSLESIIIPDSVGEIGSGAFIGCFGLKSVSIGKGVTRFQNYTFTCYGLKTIEFRGTIAEWNGITKDADWDLESGDYTVICTDGTIAKSAP